MITHIILYYIILYDVIRYYTMLYYIMLYYVVCRLGARQAPPAHRPQGLPGERGITSYMFVIILISYYVVYMCIYIYTHTTIKWP